MTRTGTAIAIMLTAAAAALAGHRIVSAAAPAASQTAASFVTPRIDGRPLDIRYSETLAADPAMTAERFCRVHGFDSVTGYSVQAASATRMIGDFSAHTGTLSAFYAIRCEGRAVAPAIAMR